MDIQTIHTLNKLNEAFYAKVGDEFDRTRQQYWEGWDQLLPLIQSIYTKNQVVSTLDVACGNARFGRFLADHFDTNKTEYLGIEREPRLLELSQEALAKTGITYSLQSIDIIQALLHDTFSTNVKGTYDVIMVFGLLHHVPSVELREHLISNLSNLLNRDGILVITSWQFAKLPRFSERFIKPELIGVDQKELEKNDYILDWKRVEVAYRYCHFADENELNQLISTEKSLAKLDSFYADGKTHSLNCYIVAQKNH